MVDFYRFAVYLGFAGLACMAVLGVANGGGGHSHAGGHGQGHVNTGGGHAAHGHSAHHGGDPGTSFGVRAPSAARGGRSVKGVKGSKSSKASFLLSFLSPQNFFSLMLGFGATGVLFKHVVPTEPGRAMLAIVGGLLFEKCLITPIWNGWMKFASTPARTLESAVYEEATAITAFDGDGCGLISIDLSGHEVRVLARLAPSETQNPLRVRAGDRLFVESVDTARNSCVVSRFGGE